MAHSDSNSSTERHRKISKKKKKRRSRSRSRSASLKRKSGKTKSKSKRSKRSRSRSLSKGRSRRHSPRSRERSRSRSRRRDSRSRSKPRDSRSRSRGQRSKSFSKGRSPRRRRSRSRSKGSDSRSKHSSHRNTPDTKDIHRLQASGDARDISQMTPMEQAKLRMKMALSAAVAADEQLKDKGGNDDEPSMADQARFHQAMDDINSDSFTPAAFTSSRSNPKTTKSDGGFGTSLDLILGPAEQTKVLSTESYAHPNLIKDPEESMTKWINKLTSMRQKMLKDSVT